MPPDHFLHNHPNFPELIRIVGREMSIEPVLVEKDYWIMHCLYGLQQMGMALPQRRYPPVLPKHCRAVNRLEGEYPPGSGV